MHFCPGQDQDFCKGHLLTAIKDRLVTALKTVDVCDECAAKSVLVHTQNMIGKAQSTPNHCGIVIDILKEGLLLSRSGLEIGSQNEIGCIF